MQRDSGPQNKGAPWGAFRTKQGWIQGSRGLTLSQHDWLGRTWGGRDFLIPRRPGAPGAKLQPTDPQPLLSSIFALLWVGLRLRRRFLNLDPSEQRIHRQDPGRRRPAPVAHSRGRRRPAPVAHPRGRRRPAPAAQERKPRSDTSSGSGDPAPWLPGSAGIRSNTRDPRGFCVSHVQIHVTREETTRETRGSWPRRPEPCVSRGNCSVLDVSDA